ncbi:putative biotin--acetyl-CoA-carboxylase ligase (BirA bifunctional protein) [Microbacterium sorbitolivorans]|uniref:Biotin--[acetyl-CoA-carboxylase] ligase n=1 Tax=Microbacterium sorbitolivorans TaxID=1867410 RepID=A0A367XUT2_9MICO|nr:biotin--[acetyl-CoA-carboxylase] ligase [Microbacterium sorbitolivorans]RCK57159.1 biotin--[acetyl-CoA-carboxylase] ligase [Microbacterium sorbitolivorans]GGF46136.1 putative biotin--acetyl-CoA-carboxylase ligase (BirA bifunctional protein) [Microbacterium sorbitolivorans]
MWSQSQSVSPRIVEAPFTGSTNADLVAALRSGEDWPHLGVLLTRDQRSGRGRLDRAWTAPPGASLAISVVLDLSRIPVERRGWIPLIAGTAMAGSAGEQLAGVGVKWPNDVLVGGRKLCGILAEVATSDRVVVGSGVNTRMTAEQLPVETAASFASLGVDVDEDALLAGYLARLGGLAERLARGSVRDEVRESCVTLGQRVTAHLPGGGGITGIATNLAEDGRLEIDGQPIGVGDIVHLRNAE